jgi:Zn finger protein HypA/HybF involved in hydrogenase expression
MLRSRFYLDKLCTPFEHEAWTVKFFMAEGYCVKCKAKKEISNGVEETMKNGRKAIKGKCPTCGTVMFKILGGKASATTTPTAAS